MAATEDELFVNSLEDDLLRMSVEQLRKLLREKGLSTQGKKKLLIKRLVKASELSNSIANNHKDKPSNNNKLAHASPPQDEGDRNSTTRTTTQQCLEEKYEQSKRRMKILKGDVEALSIDVFELSQSSNNKIKMQMRSQRLNECRFLCLDLREDFISTTVEEDDIETKLHGCKEILNEIDKAIDIAQEYIEKEICKSTAAESITSSSSKDTRQNLKLPKIELPTYNGDLLKFQNFWDQFEAAVHKNDDLPDIQKFTYLRSVLKGSALQTVEGFEVTGANYLPAVEALKHRYGRKRIIISSLIKSIINLEPTTSMSAHALRELHDTLKNRTRALEALGEQPMTHACILLPMFETKLPPRLLEKWELELADVSDEKIDLDMFFKFLNRQLVSKEAGERNQSTSSPNSEKIQHATVNYNTRGRSEKKPTHTRQERTTTASTLHVVCNTNPVCTLCKSNHDLAECKELSKRNISERWQIVKSNKLCFNCLKPSHNKHYSKICRQPKCSVANCGKHHHQLLHEQPTPTLSGFASTNVEKPMETLLPTAVAELSANGQTIQARVLLDSGSQRSYIRKNIAEAVGLKGPTESISVTTLGGNTSETKRLQRVKFSLSEVNNHSPDIAVTIEALAIPKICNQLGPVKLNLHDNIHLRNLNFADSYPRDSVEVDVLIGADFYYSFVTGNCIKGSSPNSPTAVESILGWILTGPVVGASKSTTSMFAVVENTEITRTLKRFWELEAIGIAKDECPRQSKEEQCAVEDFNRGLKFDGSNYEVQLPWKPNHADLTNNYQHALKRLEGVERKLHRDPVKAKTYSDAINQYVERGFAEEVHDKEKESKNIKYLPHHAVFRDDKATTKCRIVFDASAKDGQDVSLNDCILPGPALQPNLASVLIRFRTHKIGLLADVEKMFLQIKIARSDQDVHRYLWRDLNSDEEPRIYRMKRLTFGLNCSPFLAIATIHAHVTGYLDTFPRAARELLDNMYVDDCLTGAETEESALELKRELTTIMKAAGFNLTKWASNSQQVIDSTQSEQNESPSIVNLTTQAESTKALGVSWDLKSDCFRFVPPQAVLASCVSPTKRTVLSHAARVFDPLGLITPFTVRVKILFQELWRRGLDWDDPLENDIQKEWSAWQTELPKLADVTIARCFGEGIGRDSEVEIHGFGDASPKAYGAAVYIRITDEGGHITTQLVMSKSRVAPVKTVSLPRLELLAALVNARLVTYVAETLSVDSNHIVCYTDSMVALHWIRRNSALWKPFVANRVAEIQELCEPKCWKYCPTKDNPADLLTRGISCSEMAKSELWWKGPSWLSLCTEAPPPGLKDINQQMPEECDKERRAVHTHAAVVSKPSLDMTRYDSWLKVKRVTAYVQRAAHLFKTKNKPSQTEPTVDELNKAELQCIRWIQQETYQSEYTLLKTGSTIPNNSRILKLDPYFDKEDQLIKVGGRLQFAEIPENVKHPMILPHGHPVVERIVLDTHKHLLHAGPEAVLSSLRQKIWLTQGRREVKRIIRRCVTCQKQKVKACTQKMGPLPAERVTPSLPFTHIGIDFAGPLYIKEGSSTKKSYVCIFTCASSRMIHLELTVSLTTDEFLQAFARMTGRRGLCSTIWSDNAKTFKSASKQLKKLYDSTKVECRLPADMIEQDNIKAEMSARGIKWKFITERSPWRGGWWERMVRSVKEPLRKILGKALLTYSELNTLLIKIESVVNSRPLTAVSDDPRDPVPITPAHLTIGRPLQSIPEDLEDYQKDSSNKAIGRYLYLLRLLNQYWGRWQKEYLHQLNVRNKWFKEETPIRVGDIVMISEDNVSRVNWTLAKVEKVYTGKDKLIRTATVRTQRGVLNRPVQRLHKLEVETSSCQQQQKRDFSPNGGETCISPVQSCKPTDTLDVVPKPVGQSGEDVRARTSRYGRPLRAPQRYEH